MATLITLIKATPLSAVYRLTGDGSEGTRSAATIISDAADGPLKAEIVKRATALDALNLDGAASGRVRIRPVFGINNTITLPFAGFRVRWTSTALSTTLGQGATLDIEIRFEHSEDR
jgi:hypothetical protein